jgi:hypothetical protein
MVPPNVYLKYIVLTKTLPLFTSPSCGNVVPVPVCNGMYYAVCL